MAKRFVAGQKIRALPGATLNDMFDRLARLEKLLTEERAKRPPQGDRSFLPAPIKNMTGVDLVERSIVKIDVSGFTPPEIVPAAGMTPEDNTATDAVLGAIPLEVVKPVAGKPWIVTRAPIVAGSEGGEGHGFAVVTGLVWVRVDFTNASHKFVDCQTDDTLYLKSSTAGVPIIDRKLADEEGDDTLGKQWALINLGGGGGGSATGGPSNYARVLSGGIDPSTGPAPAQYGHGNIQLLNGDGSLGDVAVADNPMPVPYLADAMVEVSGVLVKNGTCSAVPWDWEA